MNEDNILKIGKVIAFGNSIIYYGTPCMAFVPLEYALTEEFMVT